MREILIDKYNKRLVFLLMAFIVVAVSVAFLNLQMDDERHYGLYDYEKIPEQAYYDGGVVNVDDSTGVKKGEIVSEIPPMHVDAGTYTIDVDHQNEEDYEAIVFDGNKEIERFTLPKEDLNTRYTFYSKENIYNLKIDYIYNGNGRVAVKRTILYSDDGPFYYDTVLYAVLIILVGVIIVLFFIRKKISELPKSEVVFWALFFIFLVLVNYPFYRPFDANSRGDIGYHMARVEGIYRGLIDGQFPVMLYTDVMHGRGMIGALYPHLFFSIPAILRILHISMEGAFRTFLITINTATCLTAFYSARVILRDKRLSMLTMMLYAFLPYRITVLTWRYSYGEALAFVFFPLIIAGIYHILYGDKNKWPLLAVGLSGVIESHILSTLMVAFFCGIIAIAYGQRLIKTKRIVQTVYAIIMTGLLNLWFIVTFCYYYFSDIEVNNQASGDMSHISYYFSQMLQFLPNNSEGTGQIFHQVETIGIWLVALVLLAVLLQFIKDNRDCKDDFAMLLILVGLFFAFMCSKTFPWQTIAKFERLSSITSMIEFPTRFYYIAQGSLLFGSVLAISSTEFINHKKGIIYTILILATIQGYVITDSFLVRLEPFTDSREARFAPDIADAMDYDFYAPNEYDNDNFNDTISSPKADISDYYHNGRRSSFGYTAVEGTYVDIPLTYYKGFRAVRESDGTELPILVGNMGCIRIELPPSIHDRDTVIVEFVSSPLWMISIIISICSLATIIFILAKSKLSQALKLEG